MAMQLYRAITSTWHNAAFSINDLKFEKDGFMAMRIQDQASYMVGSNSMLQKNRSKVSSSAPAHHMPLQYSLKLPKCQ